MRTTVTLDRAPVASNSSASDAAGSTVTATAAAGVLSHATDADGDSLTVHVDIRITVHVGPVPVYHHTQRCTEHWKGDRFMALAKQQSLTGLELWTFQVNGPARRLP